MIALVRYGGIFAIDQKLIEIQNEEEKPFAPDFWNNAKEAEILVRNIRSKKKWVEGYQSAQSNAEELQVLMEFFAEGDASEEEVQNQYDATLEIVEDLEFRNMLSDESDRVRAVVQIKAGTGGTESCDGAAMLMRMY